MKRLLFVDDEPRILEGLRDLLRRHRSNWEMVFVASGEEALRELGQRHFDVVVSDMRMPGMDGATLLRHVHQRHPDVVRIVLSGYSELQTALRAVPVAHQFLSKPTTADVLESVVERACNLQALISDERLLALVGKQQRLPSLPSTYSRLMQVLADERAGARDVAAVIEGDVAMCAKVLQLVNSAYFGARQSVSSIEGAVAYLGFQLIKHLTLFSEVFVWDQQRPVAGFSLAALQQHSLAVATLARSFLCGDRAQADDAFTAGMLHDVGLLVLAMAVPESLERAIGQARGEIQPLHLVERDLFGIGHAEVGAYLLGLWGLPYPVVEAVANHHDPRRVRQSRLDVLAAVHVADALVHEATPGALEGTPALDPAYAATLGFADRLPEWRTAAAEQAKKGSPWTGGAR